MYTAKEQKMKPPFIFQFTVSCIISIVVGFTMTIAVMLHNGQPLELMPVLIQGGLATIIGIVVMLLPIVRLGDNFASFYGAPPHSLLSGMLQAIVTTTVMTFCISFGMTAFATGFETFPDGTSFLMRWLGPIVSIWGTAYLATILVLPLAVAIAPKGPKPPAGVGRPGGADGPGDAGRPGGAGGPGGPGGADIQGGAVRSGNPGGPDGRPPAAGRS
jgi:hypothetical protein